MIASRYRFIWSVSTPSGYVLSLWHCLEYTRQAVPMLYGFTPIFTVPKGLCVAPCHGKPCGKLDTYWRIVCHFYDIYFSSYIYFVRKGDLRPKRKTFVTQNVFRKHSRMSLFRSCHLVFSSKRVET